MNNCDSLSPEAVAAELLAFARRCYSAYCARVQKFDLDESSPLAKFRLAVARKYGPAGDWDPELAMRLSLHAHIYLSTATQHMDGLETLLVHAWNGLSIGPLARSVTEASGRLMWLLDFRLSVNGEGARRRVARFLLDEEDNARRYNKIAWRVGSPDRAIAGDRARVAKLAVRKPGIFWPSEIDTSERTGRLVLCGERLPGPSQIVRIAGEMVGHDGQHIAGNYGYMSGMTHPTTFGLVGTLGSSFVECDGLRFLLPRNDGKFALRLALNATRAFHLAWQLWVAWTATPSEEIDALDRACSDAERLATTGE